MTYMMFETVVAVPSYTGDMNVLHRRLGAIVLERLGVVGITLAVVTILGRIWLTEGWIHPELVDSAFRMWHLPAISTPTRIWAAVLDYGALHDRARVLSYLVEVVDAFSRPALVPWLGYHPSLTISGLLTAAVAPVLLLALLRSYGLPPLAVAALVALFVLSPHVLSVLVVYIRPAKRLAIVSILATLLLARRYEQCPSRGRYLSMLAALGAGLFVDEACFTSWVVLPVLYGPTFWRAFRWWQWAAYLLLPAAFLLVALKGLPALFAALGGPPPIDMSNNITFGIPTSQVLTGALPLIVTPLFHADWLTLVGRSVLTVFGVRPLGVLVDIAAALVLLIGAPVVAYRARRQAPALAYRLAALTVTLVLVQAFETWLDYLPSRGDAIGRAWLASFGYYYDSWAAIYIVLLIAALWQIGLAHRHGLTTGLALIAMGCVASPGLFTDANRQFQVWHLAPYDAVGVLNTTVAEHRAELESETLFTVTVHDEQATFDAEYAAVLTRLYGSSPHEVGLHRPFPDTLGRPPEAVVDAFGRLSRTVQIFYPTSPVTMVLATE